jgi:hypothetical protein
LALTAVALYNFFIVLHIPFEYIGAIEVYADLGFKLTIPNEVTIDSVMTTTHRILTGLLYIITFSYHLAPNYHCSCYSVVELIANSIYFAECV